MFLAIVPAYNEEERIGSVVTSLLPYVDEIVVIDDGSKDSTASRASVAGATVLVHSINRGQGAAIETGHVYARSKKATMVIHFDADDQFSVNDIKPAIQHLQKTQSDILFGSRFLEPEKSNIPWIKKRLLIPLGRWIDRMTGAVKLTDAHNGFRLLNEKALEKIVISQDGMAHASEIPRLAKTHKLEYTEFPVTVTYHEYGQGARGGLKIVKDLIIGYFV